MTIKDLATEIGVSNRTIQRRIEAFNETNGTSHGSGLNDEIDSSIISFLTKKKQVVVADDNAPKEKKKIVKHVKHKKPVEDQKSVIFDNEMIRLIALGIVAIADGASLSIIALKITMDETIVTRLVFFLIGIVVAYSGFKNSYDLKNKEVKSWETTGANFWIFVFFIYQSVIHGAAAGMFWSFNTLICKIVFMTAAPLAGAALAVTLFINKKQIES